MQQRRVITNICALISFLDIWLGHIFQPSFTVRWRCMTEFWLEEYVPTSLLGLLHENLLRVILYIPHLLGKWRRLRILPPASKHLN